MQRPSSSSAIIIGASMAGLMTARVLSTHFDKVIIVERDLVPDMPQARKGQPHARHPHILLAKGLEMLDWYFPDVITAIKSSGVPFGDMTESMQWFNRGGYRKRFKLGREILFCSRPFLEWKIRREVLNLHNVDLLDGRTVNRLVTSLDNQSILGVELQPNQGDALPQVLTADITIDTSGRGSLGPKWLEQLGYDKPAESVVTCGTGYATRFYERVFSKNAQQDWVFVTPDAPTERRMGGALPVEDGRWMVALSGWHGDHAPTDEAGFLAFAQSLPAPDVYDLIRRAKPLSAIVQYKFPANVRRHFERLHRFPEGYLVLGDAVCSFNPLYGQGMTSAMLQAAELDTLLKQRRGDYRGIRKPYFNRIARIIDTPWQMAVAEDFRFKETQGYKAPGTDLVNAYMSRLQRTTHRDAVVGAALLRVINLLDPLKTLFHPCIIWRVLRHGLRRQ
ncbi:hypothetical protein BN8_03402 [Fibrisoma limi BUZ 3]|uniref:Uncharacterized protein n=1 Tax=Fibrisoma limi BUZ 3 TaxID=1185876 RepID=I2GK25_9BACT|nr:hypothetical protein [Fibrisoma limi]CCH54250.1 hypothetical protein BN8_03402 [Fibrisoma limi BUZ 3]